MNRRDFFKTAGAGLVAWSLPAWLTAVADQIPGGRRPNLILILADDVGLGDVSCYGGPFPTPQLDALAQGGTRFEYCYATPLCGPSRCQLLTGQYPFRTGLINNHSEYAIRPRREIMIPTILKPAGYVTASVGKWGQMPFGPGRWGFHEWLTVAGSGRYWREQTTSYRVNGVKHPLAEGQYLPDLMHEFAVDFITRNKARPFFLYYPTALIHSPIVHTPDSQPGATVRQLYADNIAYLDKLVGKLIAELDRLHLRENTLVLFTGDNGTAPVGSHAATLHGRPIHGHKGAMLEGGSRVPLIANWPGTTPAGAVNHDLTDFSDFVPTLAELGGAALPARIKFDGRSFAPQLKGARGNPREWIYVELDGRSYVRDARFKLTDRGELFDMRNAPFEEILVPADTQEAGAIASRKRLKEILAQHPAAPRT